MNHTWNVTPQEAIEIQKKLREEVNIQPLEKPIRYIAGADISLNRFETVAYAGIIVLSFPELVEVEHALVKGEITFPYIPGLLSFREIPLLMEVWEKLKTKPDVMMVDGQGIAHPRRLGIATHFGIVTESPTIGVAKNILTGIFEEPQRVGDFSNLYDSKNQNEIIGAVFKSKERSKPLIISPGHLISLEQSIDITKKCLKGYRLPEPTRKAHILVNQFRKGEIMK